MNETIQNAINNAADSYRHEFGTSTLDGEWSETAYNDLTGEDQKQITWREFHDAIQAKLKEGA